MSIKLKVGQTGNIDPVSGVDADYTYITSSPSVLTVDADGIVTGVSDGQACVTIKETATGLIKDTILFQVYSGATAPTPGSDPSSFTFAADPVPEFEVTASISPRAFTITWAGLDITTERPNSIYPATNDTPNHTVFKYAGSANALASSNTYIDPDVLGLDDAGTIKIDGRYDVVSGANSYNPVALTLKWAAAVKSEGVQQSYQIGAVGSPGDTLTVKIDGVSKTYTIQAGDDIDTAAAGLATLINATAGVNAWAGLFVAGGTAGRLTVRSYDNEVSLDNAPTATGTAQIETLGSQSNFTTYGPLSADLMTADSAASTNTGNVTLPATTLTGVREQNGDVTFTWTNLDIVTAYHNSSAGYEAAQPSMPLLVIDSYDTTWYVTTTPAVSGSITIPAAQVPPAITGTNFTYWVYVADAYPTYTKFGHFGKSAQIAL